MPENQNEVLYHYTTANALYSILTGEEIWLTDHRFLNDRKEFTFAAEIYKKALAELEPNTWLLKLNGFPEAQKNFKDRYANLQKGWFGLSFEPPAGYQTYVFSLSADRDSLAQWRAYGNGEVCIGFRRHVLGDDGIILQKTLRRVKYLSEDNLSEQKNEIVTMLDKYVAETLGGSSTPMFFLDKPMLDCAFIKHDGFQTESEWRLVKWQPPPDLDFRKNYRPSGRYIAPCYKLAIRPAEAISEIIFGPEADPEVVKSLRELLSPSFPHLPVTYKISQSRIPYRT